MCASICSCAVKENLSLVEFSTLYGKPIILNSPIPDKIKNIEEYVQQRIQKRNCSLTKEKFELLKKRCHSEFLIERDQFLLERLHSCFLLYSNAASSKIDSVPVIIGDGSLATCESMLKNFGAISGEKSRLSERFRTNVPTDTCGGINCEGNWDVVKNDVFMLGAISALKPFHVFNFDKIPIDCLWNEEQNCPRVLAREIIFLVLSGYQVIVHPLFGISFNPPCERFEGIENVRMDVDYEKILNQLKKNFRKDQIINFCERAGIPFTLNIG
jgi:hypothetical protein